MLGLLHMVRPQLGAGSTTETARSAQGGGAPAGGPGARGGAREVEQALCLPAMEVQIMPNPLPEPPPHVGSLIVSYLIKHLL